jgi:(+)-trans-carveol dehydrogenase
VGRVEGKVAFVTGAARGQGRSHAVRLAEEGADIIALDICRQIESVPYRMSALEDLAETVRLVEQFDRRVIAVQADVRDGDAVRAAVAAGVGDFGRLDIVVANAGIASYGPAHEISESAWRDMIDTNLTGAWHVIKAAVPHMIAGGRGGSLVVTSSAAGVKPYSHMAHYTAAKHGVIGLVKTLAVELAPLLIRANCVLPGGVDTPMIQNEPTYKLFAPDLDNPSKDDVAPRFQAMNALPLPWADPVDISNAVLFLASDEARYITGAALPVDAGTLLK